MKNVPADSKTLSKRISPLSRNNSPKRFQVLVEYGPGEYVPASVSDSDEDTAEAFMPQARRSEHVDILLCLRDGERVVVSVKRKTPQFFR